MVTERSRVSGTIGACVGVHKYHRKAALEPGSRTRHASCSVRASLYSLFLCVRHDVFLNSHVSLFSDKLRLRRTARSTDRDR